MILGAGTNFIPDTFMILCENLNIEQNISFLYNHHSYGQAELCIKFVRKTMKKV